MDGKYGILLIDDDDSLAETYTRLFKRIFGSSVLLSHCYDLETYEPSSSFRPDMILLDQRLRGGENGLDLVDKLRSYFPLARIVVNSAYGSERLAISSIRKGVDDFVEGKKEDLDALVSAVKRSMEATEQIASLEEMANRLAEQCYGGEKCSDKINRILEKHSKK